MKDSMRKASEEQVKTLEGHKIRLVSHVHTSLSHP